MKKRKELFFYITVCVGTALSSSSFTVMAGMFETIHGIWVIISAILAGLFCVFIADSIAELSKRFPSAPGIRTYFKKALSARSSLFFVYFYFIFILIIGSVESCMFSLVFKQMFPGANTSLIITCMLSLIVLFNLVGLSLPRNVQMITTSVVVVAMLFIGIAGGYSGRHNISSMVNSIKDLDQVKWIPLTFGMAIFLYVGFEWVAPLGISPQSYKKLIPISMPIGITINIIIYSIFLSGLCLVIPNGQLSGNIFLHVKYSVAILGTFGPLFALTLSTLVIISTFNSGIMGGCRLIYALGREGNLPKAVTKLSSAGVPYIAILLLGVLICLFSLMVNSLGLILVCAAVGSSMICFIYAALIISGIIIKSRLANLPEGYKSWFPEKLKPSLVVILCIIGLLTLFSISGQYIQTITIFFITVGVAFLLSLAYGYRRPVITMRLTKK